MKYEYKVVAAPQRCLGKNAIEKGADPASSTIESVLNEMGVGGWEYVRLDRVALEQRGFFGSRKIQQDMLVFRRPPVGRPSHSTSQEHHNPYQEGGPVVLTAEQVRARRAKRPNLLEAAQHRSARLALPSPA